MYILIYCTCIVLHKLLSAGRPRAIFTFSAAYTSLHKHRAHLHDNTREHAVLAGRYFMALRKNITHGVTFKTLPDEMRGIGPGDYIRVRTDALPEKQRQRQCEHT